MEGNVMFQTGYKYIVSYGVYRWKLQLMITQLLFIWGSVMACW